MRRRGRSLLLTVLVTFLLGAADAPRVEWFPAPYESTSPLVEHTWVQDAASCAVRLRRLSATERQAYIARVTGLPIDPFASPPDRPEHFLSFLLEIENRSAGQTMLHPESFVLTTNRDEILAPLGMETLAGTYSLLGAELPAAYAGVKPAILEGSRILSGHESLAGLLVYRAPHPRTRNFAIDVGLSAPDGAAVKLAARYRRVRS